MILSGNSYILHQGNKIDGRPGQIVILRHSSKELTYAVITCFLSDRALEDGLDNDTIFLARLRAYITGWTRTAEGRRFLKKVGGSPNIGDLFNEFWHSESRRGRLPEKVEKVLEDNGVYSVWIDVASYDEISPVWSFDTPIVGVPR